MKHITLQRRKANSPPKKWSPKEEQVLLKHINNGNFNSKKITVLLPNRSSASIRSKTRKLRIKYDLFGEAYRSLKEMFTEKIAKNIKPESVYEAYAGAGHQTLAWIQYSKIVYACDKRDGKKKQFFNNIEKAGFRRYPSKNNWYCFKKSNKKIYFFHGDTINAAADLMAKGIHVDLIDLDTCGSTLLVLSTLLALLNPNHLTITHGEFHSLRFRREDVLRRILIHRDVNKSPLPISIDQLAMELDKSVKIASLRSHNETCDSLWAELKEETWLGSKAHGMLRRYYKLTRPIATADCLNEINH